MSATGAPGQSVSIAPGGGRYPVGHQLNVHIEFCIGSGFFDGGGVVYHNGEPVAGSTSGSKAGCADFAYADVAITLASGANTVEATICSNQGCGGSQESYPTPPNPPTISLTPHNGHNRTVACAGCFNTIVSHTTPAYVSFDTPRAVTLFYSSGQAQTRRTIEVDATSGAAIAAEKLSLRLRRGDGSYVNFCGNADCTTSGSSELFFADSAGPRRLAAQFDSAHTTGAYWYTVVVRAHYSNTVIESTMPLRVLVLNESASPYGAGWTIGGAHRLKLTAGDSLVTWDGAGRIQFFRKLSCDGAGCKYAPPPGEFDTVTYAAASKQYTRTTVDRSQLVFDSLGLLKYVADPFDNRSHYFWGSGPRLDSIVDPAGKRIELAYTSGKLASIRDVPGNRYTYVTINGSNDLTQIQDPAGGTPFKDGTYHASHRLLSRKDRRGGTWLFTYDFAAKLASDSTPAVTAEGTSQRLGTRYRSSESAVLIDPASGLGTSGNPAPLKTDSAGVGTVTPAVGSTRKVRFNAFGDVITVLAPVSEFASYTRNTDGQVTVAFDSAGQQTFSWTGPRLMQQYSVTTGAMIDNEWNTTTNRITRRHGNRIADTRYFYNGAGIRLDSVKTNSDPAARYSYDSNGRVLTVTDSKGHVTSTFYASTGLRNTDSVKAGSRRRAFGYDSLGRTVTVRHPGGRIDSTFYDVLNRVQRTGGPLGVKTTYAYGDSLFLTTVTDANGHPYKAEKNALGWDTSTVDPKGGRNWYRHNKAGQMRFWFNRRGETTQFFYDDDGRLLGRLLGGDSTEYEYGPTVLASGNIEGSDTLRFAGDTTYEIAVRGSNTFIVKTVYDSVNRDVVVRIGGQDVRYDMDSAGRVRRIQPFSANPDTILYSTDDLMTGIRWHGSWSVDHHHRPGHNVARDRYTPDGYYSQYGHEFVYDTAGHIVEQVKGFGGRYERYTYDLIGRLRAFKRYVASPTCAATDTTSEYGNPCAYTTTLEASDTFHYDPVGNRLDGSATVDSANRLLAMDGYTMDYDADGNLTRKRLADTMAFNQRLYWSSANVLDSARTTINSVTTTAKYGYDANGRRVRKTVGSTTTYYVYSGGHVQAEYSSSGTLLRRYTYFPGTDHPHAVYDGSNWHYFLSDGRGNVALLFNPALTPQVRAFYRYTPFGATDSTAESSGGSRMRFGGREYDAETRLYYNRARYYDPEVGRFISEDPLGLGGGPNVYAFSGNDPINGRDPMGKRCWTETRPKGPIMAQLMAPGFASASDESDENTIEVLVCDSLTGRDIRNIRRFLGWGQERVDYLAPFEAAEDRALLRLAAARFVEMGDATGLASITAETGAGTAGGYHRFAVLPPAFKGCPGEPSPGPKTVVRTTGVRLTWQFPAHIQAVRRDVNFFVNLQLDFGGVVGVYTGDAHVIWSAGGIFKHIQIVDVTGTADCLRGGAVFVALVT